MPSLKRSDRTVQVARGGGIRRHTTTRDELGSFFGQCRHDSRGDFGQRRIRNQEVALEQHDPRDDTLLANALSALSCWPARSPRRVPLPRAPLHVSSGRAEGSIARCTQAPPLLCDVSSGEECGTASAAFVRRYGGRLLGGSPEEEADALVEKEWLVRYGTFLEGIVEGSQHLPVFYLLKDSFSLSPVDISLTFGLTAAPWVLKPLLAIPSDRCALFGRQRTPYLAAGAFLVSSSLAGASYLLTYNGVVACLFMSTVGRCLMGAAIQGMVVEIARPQDHNGSSKMVGDFFLFRASGALLSSLVVSCVLTEMGPRTVLRGIAVLPLAVIFALARYESKVGGRAIEGGSPGAEAPEQLDTPRGRGTMQRLGDCLASPVVWGPLIYLFVYNAGPSYDDALYFFYINQMHFTPVFLGQLQMMHALAKVLGVVAYRCCLRKIPDRQLIVGLTVISLPLYLTPMLLTSGAYQSLPVDPRFLALSGELVRELFIHLQMMPAFARWVQICPVGLEGTCLSMMMGVMNVSKATSKFTSAGTAAALGVTSQDFGNLSQLIAICGASLLLPLVFAGAIPEGCAVDDVDGEPQAGEILLLSPRAPSHASGRASVADSGHADGDASEHSSIAPAG